MNRTMVLGLTVVLAASCASYVHSESAHEVFPISFWGAFFFGDGYRLEKAANRRWYGDDMTFRKGESDGLSGYLDFDHSAGYRSLVAPDTLEHMWEWGHDPAVPQYFWQDPNTRWVPDTLFPDTVAAWVSHAVNTLADHPALLGWALWDEPDGHHYHYVRDGTITWNNYYYNLFYANDLMADPLDSASVFSLIVEELRDQDTLHPVFDNLAGERDSLTNLGAYWWRSVAQLRSYDGGPNTVDCMSTMLYPVMHSDSVGDTAAFHLDVRRQRKWDTLCPFG